MKGIVLDIQRFSLHDGPGIRTTVFLKGCPLRCLWCHNPEAFSIRPELALHADRCDDTAQAAAVQAAVDEARGNGSFDVDAIESAAGVCAQHAVEVLGREMSVEEVLEEALRDVAYFRRSGGGLTLSGGEPLYQPQFTAALLAAAREAGLHTCVDTSGAVSEQRLASILPDTDLFLFDYKATDRSEHQRLTGVPNDRILQNLDFLYRMGAQVILRCPLVPGVNDDREHLEGIAALSEKYPALVDVQIMPYHDMGRDKYTQIGLTYPLQGLATADPVTQEQWISTLHRLGCTRAHIG